MKNMLLAAVLLCCNSLHAQDLFRVSDLTSENQFTGNCEGPATDKSGNLYAVNLFRDGSVAVIKPGKAPEIFVNLPEGSVGNGIRFNGNGDMFIADFRGHNVLKVDMKTRQVSIFCHNEYMNQPNDLAISNSGILFLSDPNWNNSTGNLWKVMPDGTSYLLESNMGTTNGIEVSPDDNLLYVNESIQRKVWVYDLDEQGNVSNKRLFCEFPDFGLDGMRCDAKGNLYITRYDKGSVAIFSPSGKLLREVMTQGKKTSNVTFGGPDNKTVYVTLQDRGCIEYFRVKTPGAR